VPQLAWEFRIGGYKPAQKWLKDRRGCALSWDDIGHYQKIVKILAETDRIMREIACRSIELSYTARACLGSALTPRRSRFFPFVHPPPRKGPGLWVPALVCARASLRGCIPATKAPPQSPHPPVAFCKAKSTRCFPDTF
jgi:hypothetical protein